MYLEIVLTIIAVLLLVWFVHDIYIWFFQKPLKQFAKHTGKSPEYYDRVSVIRAAFDKGDFEQVLKSCDAVLAERPFESAALSFKAYSLYHLKRYAEAKEDFELLDTLPNQDCSKMLEKINAF